ncbi:MAG TPA: aminoacyl-tRNA hydrolase [Candidatus Acidoferrales bacterium]|nr:aminoacyl-tRNA hydrolase [Candidatus Acidoferrales bacterium]
MWLIVGLGNPGREYAATPHNLGFAVIEQLAGRARVRSRQEQARSVVQRGRLDGQEVLLAQPLTYMNLSGPAVAELLRANGLTPAELMVILDDIALPFGQLRIRERGSAGGHRGLESVLAALGTDEVIRLRLGIRPADAPVGDLADYVLAPMDDEQRRQAEEMVGQAAEAVRVILREGPQKAMARFNRRADAGDSEAVK